MYLRDLICHSSVLRDHKGQVEKARKIKKQRSLNPDRLETMKERERKTSEKSWRNVRLPAGGGVLGLLHL